MGYIALCVFLEFLCLLMQMSIDIHHTTGMRGRSRRSWPLPKLSLQLLDQLDQLDQWLQILPPKLLCSGGF